MTTKDEFCLLEQDKPPNYDVKEALQYTSLPVATPKIEFEEYLKPIRKQLHDITVSYDMQKAQRRQVAHAQIMNIVKNMDEECKQLDMQCDHAIRQHLNTQSFGSWIKSFWT